MAAIYDRAVPRTRLERIMSNVKRIGCDRRRAGGRGGRGAERV
jgi:hypothetical protein